MSRPPFSQNELTSGLAGELRKVQTPTPGETVEVGYIITDCVLVINRLVEEVINLRSQIAVLQAGGGAIKFEKTESFTLPTLASGYDTDEYDAELEP